MGIDRRPRIYDQKTLDEFISWFEFYTPYGVKYAREWTPPNCGWTPEDFYREAWVTQVTYLATWWKPDGGKSIRTATFDSIKPLIRKLRYKIDIRSVKASPECNFSDKFGEPVTFGVDERTPVDDAIRNEERDLLRDKLCWGMQHCPPFFRRVAELRIEGKLYWEIGEILGISRQRVDQVWHKFLKFVREENRINPAPRDFHKDFDPNKGWQGTGLSCRKKCKLCGKYLPPKTNTRGNSRKYCDDCMQFTPSIREKLVRFKESKERNEPE